MYALLEEQQDAFEMFLPNQQYNNFFNKRMIQEIIQSLQRQINLRSVNELYATHKYRTVVDILKDSLIHTTNVHSGTNPALRISTQIEILLECFWHLELFLVSKSNSMIVDHFS